MVMIVVQQRSDTVDMLPCFQSAQLLWAEEEFVPLPASSQWSQRLTRASPSRLYQPHHRHQHPTVSPAAAAHPLPVRQNRRRSHHGPKVAITSKIKHAIKHKTSPARLAQLLHNCCSPHKHFVLACSQWWRTVTVRRHWLQAKTKC